MTRYVVLKYLPYELDRVMSDILEDMYFASENWCSYGKNLPMVISNQWKRLKECNNSQVRKGVTISNLYMHFTDNANLSGPVIHSIELALGDTKHVVKFWTAKGVKFEPALNNYGLFRRSGVSDNRALLVTVLTKDTYEETWNRIYSLFDDLGLKNERHYHVEAMYSVEDE